MISICLALTLVPAFTNSPAWGQRPSPGQNRARSVSTGSLSLNQKRIPIGELIARVGEANARTILVPDDVRGTISLVAQRPVTPDEAWAMLDMSLSMLGFSLLPSTADNWRIAKVADSIGEAPFRAEADGGAEAFVTTLIPLRFAELTSVIAVLEPLSGSRVTLVPFEPTNSLLASGSERSIARLATLVGELDRVEEQTLRLRILRYRDVDEVEPVVQTYLESQSARLRELQVWSDERTNALILRGDDGAVAEVIDLLGDLDRPVEGGGSIRILRVLHRDAEEVAELIRSMATSTEDRGRPASAAATPLDDADFSIAVDAASRSLVVRADPETHEAIREVLETLDEPAQLIAVDITVSELRTPDTYGLALGFVAPFATGDDASEFVGVVSHTPSLEGVQAAPTFFGRVQRDTGVSFVAPGDDGNAVTVPVLQSGTFAAADFEGRTEVLIQPSLIVTAGEQHEIFVGDNIPIPVTESGFGETDSSGSAISALTRSTRIDRRDVGIRLGIEAGSGREGRIRLGLEIEIAAINPAVADLGLAVNQIGAIFSEQKLTTTAQLADGETAILAVDRRQDETVIDSGVPFFRDLPFFGSFFRTRGTVREDIRLVIAARARRISSPAEFVADTIRRRLIFERQRARESTLPEIEGPPFGVRVTTRSREDDALAIARGLELEGYRTRMHSWTVSERDYHDVYVVGLDSMVEAARVARTLGEAGWEADLVLLSKRS